MKRKYILGCSSLIGMVLCMTLPAIAETKVSQDASVDYQQIKINSPESKFEEYGEVQQGVTLEHYGLSSEGDKVDLDLNVNKLRLNNESADVKVQGSKFTAKGSWDQIPHFYSKEAKTLYTDDGHGNLTLPDPIQQSLQTGGNTPYVNNFIAFSSGAHVQELKTLTSKGDVDLGFNLSDSLKLNFGASETMKKGTINKGVRIDSDLTEFPRPVDFKTYNTNLGLGYASKCAQWGLNYNFSTFKDGLDSLKIDNPIRLTDTATGAGAVRVTLEPDNYAHSVNFDGGADLPAKSRITAKTAFNFMGQNERLVGVSANPFIAMALPEETAHAKTINWVQDYNLSSRAIKNVDLGFRFHSDALHNKTNKATFPGEIETESAFENGPFQNEPYNVRKNSLIESIGYQVFSPLHLNAKYGSEWINRDNREVRKQRENTLTLAADYKPCRATMVRASLINAKRRMKDFNEDIQDDISIPNFRMFDTSDRDRTLGSLLVQLNAGKAVASLNGAIGHDKYLPGTKGHLTGSNTNYANMMLGLQDTRTARAGADIDLDVSERISFNTYYEYQQDKTLLRNDNKSTNQTGPDDGMFEQHQDIRYDMGGIGVNVRAIKEFLDIKVGYDITNSVAKYDFSRLDFYNIRTAIGTGNKQSPPKTRTTNQNIFVKGNIRATSNLGLGLAYMYEKYDVTDWATDGLGQINPVSSGARSVFLGDATHDYVAHIVTLSANYKF